MLTTAAPLAAGMLTTAARLAAGVATTIRPVNGTNNLARVAWLATVGVLMVVVVILGIEGYIGNAGVTLAVAIAAGINLL
jgi:hypothetical protein